MENYKTFKRIAESMIIDFNPTYEEKKFYNNIVEYFCNGDTTLDKSKGILLLGNIGTGKSILFKILQRMQEVSIYFAPCFRVVEEYESSKQMNNLEKFEVVYDDLGAELQANYYGKMSELMEKTICSRYELFQNKGIKTHFTSNANEQDLENRYGARAYDRLKEMVNLVIIPWNESRREAGKLNHSQEEEKELSDQEKQENINKSIQLVIDEWKRVKESGGTETMKEDFGFTYNLLEKNKILIVEDSKKWEVFEACKQKLIEKKCEPHQRTEFKHFLDGAINNSFHKRVITMSRKVLLDEFISECIEFDTDLELKLKELIK